MLVVVEDRDIALFLQLLFDLEAAGRGDVLQVHAAAGAGDQVNGVDDLVHILGLDAQRKGVHVAEGLEQHALALHHRHAGLGADVAQTQHSGAVGDHQAGVPAAGQLVALVHILLNLQTGLCNAGSVSQGQILLGGDGNAGHDFNLALALLVQAQALLCIIHIHTLF